MTDIEKLNQLFDDHQLYHSEFQMDYLITVRSGGTVYGMYKQALRELYKRYRGLKSLYSSKNYLKLDIEEAQGNHFLRNGKDNYETRRLKIWIGDKYGELLEIEKNIEDTQREFERFYAQAVTLKKQVGDLTPERRRILDLEMWIHKIKSMAAVDYMTQGRLGVNTVEFLIAFPKGHRGALLEQIAKRDTLIKWFEGQEASKEIVGEEDATTIRNSSIEDTVEHATSLEGGGQPGSETDSG